MPIEGRKKQEIREYNTDLNSDFLMRNTIHSFDYSGDGKNLSIK